MRLAGAMAVIGAAFALLPALGLALEWLSPAAAFLIASIWLVGAFIVETIERKLP